MLESDVPVLNLAQADISSKCSQHFTTISEDILSEQLEDGKNDSFLSRLLNESSSLVDYAENSFLIDYDLSSLVEETIKSTPSAKIIEIETHYDGNEFQVRGTLENTEHEELSGHTHYVRIKQIKGAPKPTKTWECGICKKEFQHHYTLMRHLPTHTDVRKYVCKVCGKAFRQMSTLSQHKAIHTNVRPHICEMCSKAFNRISTLISHRRTHSEMKPHKCPVCGKGFHQKGNMRNHVFTHTNERPYKCDVCFKGFNQMSNLMCHKLHVHGDTKDRFSCDICGAVFENKGDLREHRLNLHPSSILASSKSDGVDDSVKENLNFDENFNNCLLVSDSESDVKENVEIDWNQGSFVINNNYGVNQCNGNSLILNPSEFIEETQARNETANCKMNQTESCSTMLTVLKTESGLPKLLKFTPLVKSDPALQQVIQI